MSRQHKWIRNAYLGIDVGTGSARASIFDSRGGMLSYSKRDIRTWYEPGGFVEQSTSNIWAAVSGAVREALSAACVSASEIGGIGVDATCSLVVVDPEGAPLAVGPTSSNERNVIVWMDHRAAEQAERINIAAHPVLRYVGGTISPEMETPKLLWLKENMRGTYLAAGHFFDLADYLTWRLTGSLARSICTVTCKWTYLAHEKRWDPSYFDSIGLGDLATDFDRIGTDIVNPGSPLGGGLTIQAAQALDLLPGTPVGAALIDAHAGGLGSVGAIKSEPIEGTLAYILGTSACAMASSKEPISVPGIWGPYYSAMIPGYWLNEAGQSAAGAAIDFLVESHPASAEAQALAAQRNLSLAEWLEQQAVVERGSLGETAFRARQVHVVPDFNGNRSPFADPEARGVVAGLRTERTISSLVDLYVSGICSLGYGLAQIVSALMQKGIVLRRIIVSGGMARSQLARQILADVTGLPVAVPLCSEPVLLGAAMLGATAARTYPDLVAAIRDMSQDAVKQDPDPLMTEFHRAKARVFEELQKAERLSRTVMQYLLCVGQ